MQEPSTCSASAPAKFTALAISALFIASIMGCAAKEKVVEPEVAVRTGVVEQATIEGTVETDAVLYPLHQAAITPKITAPVRQFFVQRGSKVHQGQLLAELENRDLAAAALESNGTYQQAQADFASATASTLPEEMQKAESDAASTKAAYDAEQKAYDSRVKLYQEGAIPRKEVDQSNVSVTQAKNNYELAQKHLSALQAGTFQQHRKAAQGQLTAAEGKHLASSALLNYTKITSPIDGVVTDRPIYPGETTAAGAPLLVVMDTSRVIARAHVASQQATRLRSGDKAILTAPGLSAPATGKVTLVSPALDPNSTTVEIWVEAANPKGELRPGSNAHLSIAAETAEKALVVPASALLTGPDGATTVMLVSSDSHAHQQAVEVGIRRPDEVQITKGVKEGDRVIVSGAYALPDNTKVKEETVATKADGSEKAKGE